MPIFAKLFAFVTGAIFSLVASIFGAQMAVRLIAVASLAAIYISCVLVFTRFVAPYIGSVFNTQYGQFLGLLFPPISGTILTSLALYWTCVIGVKYTVGLTKLAIG